MTTPAQPPKPPPPQPSSIPLVANIASAICPSDLGYQGAYEVDGVLHLVPIIGWVTTSFMAPNGQPAWRFQPLMPHPERLHPVHIWDLPPRQMFVVIPKDWDVARAEAFIAKLRKIDAGQPPPQNPGPGYSFPQGGQGQA